MEGDEVALKCGKDVAVDGHLGALERLRNAATTLEELQESAGLLHNIVREAWPVFEEGAPFKKLVAPMRTWLKGALFFLRERKLSLDI